MAWPDHTKGGEAFSAMILQEDIIFICQARLESEMLPPTSHHFYDLILAHAMLDHENHAHGLLRDFVEPDGTGVPPNPNLKLDAAWDNVNVAHGLVSLPNPSLPQLGAAMNGIDHGGGGGVL